MIPILYRPSNDDRDKRLMLLNSPEQRYKYPHFLMNSTLLNYRYYAKILTLQLALQTLKPVAFTSSQREASPSTTRVLVETSVKDAGTLFTIMGPSTGVGSHTPVLILGKVGTLCNTTKSS